MIAFFLEFLMGLRTMLLIGLHQQAYKEGYEPVEDDFSVTVSHATQINLTLFKQVGHSLLHKGYAYHSLINVGKGLKTISTNSYVSNI